MSRQSFEARQEKWRVLIRISCCRSYLVNCRTFCPHHLNRFFVVVFQTIHLTRFVSSMSSATAYTKLCWDPFSPPDPRWGLRNLIRPLWRLPALFTVFVVVKKWKKYGYCWGFRRSLYTGTFFKHRLWRGRKFSYFQQMLEIFKSPKSIAGIEMVVRANERKKKASEGIIEWIFFHGT